MEVKKLDLFRKLEINFLDVCISYKFQINY